MLGRATAVAVLMLSLVVLTSGCISNGKKDEKIQATNTTGGLLPNQTVAPDGRGSISAFNETNKTETKGIGAMVHTHDFWKGKERLDNVAWIPVSLIPIPITPCKKSDNSCTAGTSNPGGADTYPAATAIADFDLARPPTMGMIYEGTKIVELKMKDYQTLNAQGNPVPGNPAGHVFFDYLPANDEPGKFRTGGELKLNEAFKIEIKPTDADMPHQTKSLWVFRIYSDSQMGSFQANVTISLQKGYDVVNWPPHPNLYAEKANRVVYDGPAKQASKGTIDGEMYGSDAGWLSPQKVISWGTDRIEVEMTNVVFTSTVPAPPKGLHMQFRNASSPFRMGNLPNWGTMDDKASDGKSYHFTIDITKDDGSAYDTPYAQYSRWGFRLTPYWDDNVGCSGSVGEFLFDCQWYPWDVSYNLKITAIGHSTAEGVPAGAAQ